MQTKKTLTLNSQILISSLKVENQQFQNRPYLLWTNPLVSYPSPKSIDGTSGRQSAPARNLAIVLNLSFFYIQVTSVN